MKKILFLFLLSGFVAFAQTNTEVYLFDLKKTDDGYTLTNKKNISNNKGYDSQPHFYDNNTLLFSSSRNGQTDIARFNIQDSSKVFLNSTPNGGEYSPQRIPGSDNVSAVRLDNSGLQRFYRYDLETGKSTELIRSLKVAYPVWFNKKTVVSAVIGKNSLDLVTSDLQYKSNLTIQKNIGRSLHKIPNTNKVSFISKKEGTWQIRSLDVGLLRTQKIVDINGKYEDMCWMSHGSILLARKNQILIYNPKTDKDWRVMTAISDSEIQNISRITVSPDGSKIAIVGEESPRFIVQKQVEAYNDRNLDAFANTFSDDVKVYDYPAKLRYQGKKELKRRYGALFANTPDLNCLIVKRIESGTKVIDEELVTINGRKVNGVAIYEVKNGKIVSMTFL
jgi:hypothetical protein